jgi:hypothetical protein
MYKWIYACNKQGENMQNYYTPHFYNEATVDDLW